MSWIYTDCRKRNLQHREFCACGNPKPKSKTLIVGAAIAALVAAYTPAYADFERQIVLSLTIVTPHGMPDIQKTMPMSGIEACWASATEFAKQDLEQVKAKFPQALGIAAGCGVLEKPSIKN
jgi:hypothetical protein